MIAAHRDQENRVYSQQVPTKQAPKTPGARYPKTPSGFGRRDENALGANGGKGAVGDGKLFVKGLGASQIAMTPMATQTRAVLGDKTTNARAKTGQGKTGEPKGFDKSQARQSPVRRPKSKQPASSRKLSLATSGGVAPEYDEPEYAPPRPKDLPYQSDVLPKGGLSFEGIKKERLFKGFYQHFHDAVDEDGLSRHDRLLNDEMAAVLEEAVQRNDEQTGDFSWGLNEIPEELHETFHTKNPMGRHFQRMSQGRDASITSRHAAVALAMQAPQRNSLVPKARSASSSGDVMIDTTQSPHPGTTIGEAASRTSIGYAKGRSTSSVLHPREEIPESFSARAKRVIPIIDGTDPPLTMTPSHPSQAVAPDRASRDVEEFRPAFMSIFDGDFDDLDLGELSFPFNESDEEEEFELRLEI